MDVALIILIAALFCVCSLWFHDLKRFDREHAAREQAEESIAFWEGRCDRLQQFGAVSVRTARPGPPAPNADKEVIRVRVDGLDHSFTEEALKTARDRDVHLFGS